jgi:hypothetical protein
MIDPGLRSPLLDFFRRGEMPREARLLAAQGALAPRAVEQIALLVLLTGDADPDVARTAAATLDRVPVEPLRAFLARSDVTEEIRRFFAGLGIEPAEVATENEDPLIDTLGELPQDGAPASDSKVLSLLPILERLKLAMKGSREQRAQLIRDSNKMVAVAVLSSPKLNEAEVEAFTKMGNIAEDVLRVIATNRGWTKNYGVILGLCRNPKTPPALSMQLIHRLNERDMKMLSMDRNVSEPLRVLARKIITKTKFG